MPRRSKAEIHGLVRRSPRRGGAGRPSWTASPFRRPRPPRGRSCPVRSAPFPDTGARPLAAPPLPPTPLRPRGRTR